MYSVDDKFLYEILDDYKDAITEDEKNEIVNSFMKLIWSSKNKRSVYQKDYRFSVSKSLLNTEIGQIFNTYSEISYTVYKSMSKDLDFVSLIRQKVNNLYTNLCDGRVCLKKEYMDLIKLPKQMYYRWKSGEIYDSIELTEKLEDTLIKATEVKEKYAKQKMNIAWNEYKTLIAPYFKRMFENYIPLEDYEDKSKITVDIDMWNEDNFAIAYLCKGLDGYMRDYQKLYYGVKKRGNKHRCIDCGVLFQVHKKDNKSNRCPICYKIYRKKYKAINEKNRRTNKNGQSKIYNNYTIRTETKGM